ncbi:NUMOD4 domain-containing protein [Clostridium perfringens]|nr:NUMOD4 domain-containing protein [Clostridium perfringens]
MEVWKEIKGYEGMYQISNLGRVKALERIDSRGLRRKEKILKYNNTKNGYLEAVLCKNGKTKHITVHRLVAIHFIENINNLPIVNHIDGNKQNNKVDNLEWCTYSYNVKHAFRTGLAKITDETREKMSNAHKGEKSSNYNKKLSDLTRNKISKSKKKIGENKKVKIICITTDEKFDSLTLASQKYNVRLQYISACCRGKQKSAGKHAITGEKLVWKYLKDSE